MAIKKETKSTVKAAPAKSTASSKTQTSSTVQAKKSTKTKGISDDDIAKYAFMLWEKRGGDALANWLEAERSLR